MKIAISSDFHLTEDEKHFERYYSLKSILEKLKEKNINTFIIAGDLFDRNYTNHFKFDSIAKKFNQINFFIIPGNHDHLLKNAQFEANNIKIIENTQLFKFSENLSILFVPFVPDTSMDEAIITYFKKLKEIPKKWILIGHGEYLNLNSPENPYEKGNYMSLTKNILKRYKPHLTILGHIHKPMDFKDENLFYPGSPCSIDHTEIGKRYFIILNLHNLTLKREEVETKYLFFDENFFLMPYEDEENMVGKNIEKMIERWEISESDLKKVNLKLNLIGFTNDIKKVIQIITKKFKEKGINEINLNRERLHTITSKKNISMKLKIVNEVLKEIEKYKFENGLKDKVILNVIAKIFG